MVWIALIAALMGCSKEPVCVDLKVRDDMSNHVQVYEVAIDQQRRRVYSSALGSAVLLAYDADTYEPVQDYPLGSGPLTTPDIEVDSDGNVWVAANTSPPVMRFEEGTGDRDILWGELVGARDLAPRAAGGMVVLGRSEGSNNALVAYDADAQPVATLELASSTRGLISMDGAQHVAVTVDEYELIVLSTDDLSEVSRCPIAMQNPWRGAQLDDGTVVLANEGSIGTACVDTPEVWRVGEENMEVVSLGDHALVLDRIGDEPGYDPNLGIGRLVDAQGVYGQYPTAKNTGFGAYDSATGLVWVNSEGTSEVLAMDPVTGELLEAIRGGTFLDGLAVDPDDHSVLYATGRLSDTMVRIEDDLRTADTRAVHWPYSPVLDLERDLLWVLSHTESVLHAVDREDLSAIGSIDPGLGSNTLLTFGNILIHPGRGTLFFAESQRDILLELDPGSGDELGRWDLGGPLITDPDAVGELAMRIDPDGGQVYLARSNDARVQRLDPNSGELWTVFLPDDVTNALSAGHRTDFMRLYPDEALLFIGGKAVHMEDLERWTERDLPVTRIVGRDPNHYDRWIAVDDAMRHIVIVDNDGEEHGRQVYARHELYATVFKVSPKNRSVYMTRALHGMVCSFPVKSLK